MGWRFGALTGGLIGLARIGREHPGPVRADFRQLYSVSWDDIGTKRLSYREAFWLVRQLTRNPESLLSASITGWKHPVSFEWMVLAELVDLTVKVNSKRQVKPFPRPWARQANKMGRTVLSRERVIELLTTEDVRDVE